MKFVFESNVFMSTVSRTISILTESANVCVNDIHYDKANGIVEIYMLRKELTGFKKSFLRETQPVYSQTMIKSLLTIRQVEAIKIKVDDRLITNCNSCFTILFGLKMDNNQLYLGSVEEIRGIILCQIFIKIRDVYIEFSDEEHSE